MGTQTKANAEDLASAKLHYACLMTIDSGETKKCSWDLHRIYKQPRDTGLPPSDILVKTIRFLKLPD